MWTGKLITQQATEHRFAANGNWALRAGMHSREAETLGSCLAAVGLAAACLLAIRETPISIGMLSEIHLTLPIAFCSSNPDVDRYLAIKMRPYGRVSFRAGYAVGGWPERWWRQFHQ